MYIEVIQKVLSTFGGENDNSNQKLLFSTKKNRKK